MQISDRLQQERERLRLTQSQMAKLGQVAMSTYCDYESGKSEPRASFFAAIALGGADIVFIITGQTTQNFRLTQEEHYLLASYRCAEPAQRAALLAVSRTFDSK